MKDMRAQGYDNGPYMEGLYKVFEAEKLDKQVINQIIRDLGHLQNNWDSLIQETRLVCTEMNIEPSLDAYDERPVQMVRSTQIISGKSNSIVTGVL